MQRARHLLNIFLLSAAFLAPVLTTGCAERHYYRVYDPYYHDYHEWHDEDPYYRRWYGENHHDQYREYKKLDNGEQKRYWDWRHAQDHDREHH